jgi:short subunit dehydrogenase-like uncharacterized protein
VRRKTLVVPLCGFDSVPSDVGCRMVVDHVRQRLRAEVCEVDGLFALGGGGASRGTLNSMVGVVSDTSALRAMRAPFALNPPDKVPEPSERAQRERARGVPRLRADPSPPSPRAAQSLTTATASSSARRRPWAAGSRRS